MKRREFLQGSAAGITYVLGAEFCQFLAPCEARGNIRGGGIDIDEALEILERGKPKNIIPEIRPEIRNNPRAVFLVETHASGTPDNRGYYSGAREQLTEAGKEAAKAIFVKGSRKGGSTLIKPNMVGGSKAWDPTSGINTSADFIAGFVESMRELGNTNIMVGERGGGIKHHRGMGVYTAFDPHNVQMIEALYPSFAEYRRDEINWHRVPHPTVWKNIPTWRPIGDKDNLFINMPKLKNHNLGLTTLSTKNLQGAVPAGYGQYCWPWQSYKAIANGIPGVEFTRDFVGDYQQRVEAGFVKHKAMGFKYWDYEDSYGKYQAKGGWEAFRKIKDDPALVREFTKDLTNLMWDELWCQRALDSSEALPQSLNIIEGVIGRDGSGFDVGKDQLCNIVIVGLSRTETDAVGSWIMGHDPTQLFYTRIARERGLGECDPSKIDIYRIRKGEAVRASLAELPRHRLGVNLHTHAETGERLFW
jgi:uncharacterized protein (DUF362 family)